MMQDARIRAALLVVCLASLLGSGIVLLGGRHAASPPVVITPPPAEMSAAAAPSPTAPHPGPAPAARVYVDVAGAVRRPSLYVLPPDSRVMQAIRAAGGPAADADMDGVNLAQKVTDGEKVFVPHHTDAPPAPAPTEAAATAAPARTAARAAGGAGGSHAAKMSPGSGEQIALNTATLEQLERLPGVGPSLAARILAYRQTANGFGKIEDLQQVTGIGPKKYAKIAPCVRLN